MGRGSWFRRRSTTSPTAGHAVCWNAASPGTAIFAASDFGFKTGDERLNAIRDDASIIATLAAFNVPLAKRMGEWLGNAFAFSDIGAYFVGAAGDGFGCQGYQLRF